MMTLLMPSHSNKMSLRKSFSGYGQQTTATFYPQHLSNQHQASWNNSGREIYTTYIYSKLPTL